MGDMNRKGSANEAKGAMKEAAGRVKGDVGDALDDSKMHSEGRADQVKGNVQKNFGKAERALDPDRDVDSSRTDKPRRQ